MWHVTLVHSQPKYSRERRYNIIMTRFIYGMSHWFTPQSKCSRERRYNIIMKNIYMWHVTSVHSQPKCSRERHLQLYHDKIYMWHVTLVHSQPKYSRQRRYNIIMKIFICGMSHRFTPKPKCSRERHLQHYHDKIYIWHVTSVHPPFLTYA